MLNARKGLRNSGINSTNCRGVLTSEEDSAVTLMTQIAGSGFDKTMVFDPEIDGEFQYPSVQCCFDPCLFPSCDLVRCQNVGCKNYLHHGWMAEFCHANDFDPGEMSKRCKNCVLDSLTQETMSREEKK